MRSAAWMGGLAVAVLLAIAACAATPDAQRPPTVIMPAGSCPPGTASAGCEDADRSLPASAASSCADGPRCEGVVDAAEAQALPRAVDAAQKDVLHTTFGDVHAMVRLACLQLRRDADVAEPDGPTDAARGLRNAMRAVAVDDASVEARLALALGIARSLQTTRASGDPALRGLALGLVEQAIRAVPEAPGAAGAAVKTLEGYLAMERGQRALAQASFEAATRLDPRFGTAWAGLGDLARGASDFPAAVAAYQTAAARLPKDPGVARALAAAARREAMALPAALVAPWATIAPGPLAPPPPPLPACSAAQAAARVGTSLCQGLARLAVASSRADHEQAAGLIVTGWTEMLPLCDARDPACGPHVVQAIAAASRAFRAAGRAAKSIAVAKLVLDRSALPGAAALEPGVTLEIGDGYFTLGILDTAADWYARYLRTAGTFAGPVAERALMLYVALANVNAATSLADELAGDTRYAAAQRSRWIGSTAALLRAVRGSEEAVSWLGKHQALLDEAGAHALVAEVSTPLPGAAAPAVRCAAPLSCAVRRLAGETW